MASLAAQMQPGSWAELSTANFMTNGVTILQPSGDASTILEYADSAAWDPVGRRFLFVGTSHGTSYGSRFVIYRDSDNTWATGPLPSTLRDFGTVTHAYDHNTADPATGDFYVRPVYWEKQIFRYSGGTWTALPLSPERPGSAIGWT